MTLRRIAALVLVVYATIGLAASFHVHSNQKADRDCSLCQVVHAAADAPTLASHAISLTVERVSLALVEAGTDSRPITQASPRSPPVA